MKRNVKILITYEKCGNISMDYAGNEVRLVKACEAMEDKSNIDSKSIPALLLAKHSISIANNSGHTITNLKLQKVLYYLQGLFYRQFRQRLFSEPIEAWKLGPVVPNVYFEYSMYGSEPLRFKQSIALPLAKNEVEFINEVINQKSACSSYDLVESTHNEDPWKNASDNGNNVGVHRVIPFDEIASFFMQQ